MCTCEVMNWYTTVSMAMQRTVGDVTNFKKDLGQSIANWRLTFSWCGAR